MRSLLKLTVLAALLLGASYCLASWALGNVSARVMPLLADELFDHGFRPPQVSYAAVDLQPRGVRWRELSTELSPLEEADGPAYRFDASAVVLEIADFSLKRYQLRADDVRLIPLSAGENDRGRPTLIARSLELSPASAAEPQARQNLLLWLRELRRLALGGRSVIPLQLSGELRFPGPAGQSVIKVQSVSAGSGSTLRAERTEIQAALKALGKALSPRQVEELAADPVKFTAVIEKM